MVNGTVKLYVWYDNEWVTRIDWQSWSKRSAPAS